LLSVLKTLFSNGLFKPEPIMTLALAIGAPSSSITEILKTVERSTVEEGSIGLDFE
jgi:hypothetical protein